MARLSDWMGAMAGLGGMAGLPPPLDPPLQGAYNLHKMLEMKEAGAAGNP